MSVPTRIECVRSFFEIPDRYLRAVQYNLRIRRETIQELLGNSEFESILDIGCGDGSLSIPLLTLRNRLTLVDLSKSMLSIARKRVPAELRANVETVNQDFIAANLREHGYDLILCVGVLAHVDDPLRVIGRIASLTKPGGSIIVEISDSCHFISRLWRFRSKVREAFAPAQYKLNEICHRSTLSDFVSRGFALAGIYRYSIPLPGMQKVFGHAALYRGVRAIYGTARSNRNSWLGNELLYHFKNLGATPRLCDTRPQLNSEGAVPKPAETTSREFPA